MFTLPEVYVWSLNIAFVRQPFKRQSKAKDKMVEWFLFVAFSYQNITLQCPGLLS